MKKCVAPSGGLVDAGLRWGIGMRWRVGKALLLAMCGVRERAPCPRGLRSGPARECLAWPVAR